MSTDSASQERMIYLDHEEKVAFIANARFHLVLEDGQPSVTKM